MRKILFILLLVMLSSCSSSKTVLKEKKSNLFLWEIKSKTSNTTSYLLGLNFYKNMVPLDKRVEEAYNKSDILLLETNVDYESNEFKEAILNKFSYKYGRTLKDDLPTNIYNKVIEFSKNYGMDSKIIKLKPSFALIMLSEAKEKELGYNIYNVNVLFKKKAEAENKKILELENIDELLSWKNTMKQYVFEDYEYFFKNITNMKKEFEELLNIQKTGDLNRLLKFSVIKNHSKEYIDYEREQLKRRNTKMVKRIIEYLSNDKSYFISIGVFNLAGEYGIINLLRKKGYIVRKY